jgi:amino-acid N-acetyltransferase
VLWANLLRLSPPAATARVSVSGASMKPSTIHVSIERAKAGDGPSILQLLSAAQLPVDGLIEHLDTAVVARGDGGGVAGCAALEIYADGALLRSVVVDGGVHGQGIGTRLTTAALDLANVLGIPAVYLLTTTAEAFFPRFGFVQIPRADLPGGVQMSVEFRSACPSTAIVMRRTMNQSDSYPTQVLTSDPPVVCTLSPEALATRRQGLLAELLTHADAHDEFNSGHRFSFAASDETLALIAKTVAAERHCCSFLRFQITVEPGGGPVILEITGPEGTREFLAAMFES